MADLNAKAESDFHLDPSGDQLLFVTNRLWADLKAGTPSYMLIIYRIFSGNRLK